MKFTPRRMNETALNPKSDVETRNARASRAVFGVLVENIARAKQSRGLGNIVRERVGREARPATPEGGCAPRLLGLDQQRLRQDYRNKV
jgi:hypothetical protein